MAASSRPAGASLATGEERAWVLRTSCTGYWILPSMQKPTAGETSFRRAALIALPDAVHPSCEDRRGEREEIFAREAH